MFGVYGERVFCKRVVGRRSYEVGVIEVVNVIYVGWFGDGVV